MKTNSSWIFKDGTFKISNYITTGDLAVFKWSYSFNIITGKEKLSCSADEKSLDRFSFISYKKNIIATKKIGFDDFIKKFYRELEFKSSSLFFHNKKISAGSCFPKFYKNVTILPLTDDFKGEVKGLALINEDTEKVSTFSVDENLGIYIKGSDEGVYFCLGLEDGFNCENLTKRNTAIFLKKEDLFYSADNYATQNFNNVVTVLGSNPTERDILGGTPPIEFLDKFRGRFKALNLFVKFPPFMNDKEAKTSINFYDYFLVNPDDCEKILLQDVENVNFRILGFDSKSVVVFSKYLTKPKEISQTDKMSNLLLVAPKEFYKNKFNSTKEKNIISNLFDLSRGKVYHPERIRGAGLFKDGKNLIINTGKKIIGSKNLDPKYTYLQTGNFPDPKKCTINALEFFKLKTEVLDSISFNNNQEGYSIIAWSILSLFATVLPARFSLHLYGDSSSGKSFTRDEIIIGLQKKFMYVIRKFVPGYTYAAFKDDLRFGASVLHFDEAEGSNYDENIIKITRASTYEKTELKQMKGASGGTTITPINFMSSSSYNFAPHGETSADKNRVYGINYSTSRVILEKRNNTLKALLSLDLPKLGYDLFSSLYYNWKTFIDNSKNNQNDPKYFGLFLNGHKRVILSQIVSFYQTLEILDKETLEKYVEFLKDKEKQESHLDFNSSYVDAIGRIELKGADGFRNKTIRTLLTEVEDLYNTENFQPWAKWVRHFYQQYQIKVFKAKKTNILYIALPQSGTFIPYQLIKMGIDRSQANSYVSILKSKFNKLSKIKFIDGDRYCVCVPLSFFISKSLVAKWEALDKSSQLEGLYR